MSLSPFDLLEHCENPYVLKTLDVAQLPILCQQLRQYLLKMLNEVGGHCAASLGVVELTVALHYIFNTPDDRFVWDVGHQAYIHKMLTNRAQLFQTLRKEGGISGFPARAESEYDAFGVGHSSTSISAALGMALANAHQGNARKTVAIIGDGALTAGMAFEALNHAGDVNADMLVILNDNGLSISPNVGALAKTMQQYAPNALYQTVQQSGRKLLDFMPTPLKSLMYRTKQHMDELLQPGSFFTELGFAYTGPVDGHDLSTLLEHLKNLKEQSGPRVLHVLTQKGKGYAPAEADPIKYHAVSTGFMRPRIETEMPAAAPKPTYSDVFAQWVCDMAQNDARLVALTAATCEGSGLVKFSEQFPSRYYDVGIAEQHCVTFAAGLACEGLKPVVAMYSTFLQRAYDQAIHDVALQQLPVLFAVDRGGLVGADGPTHTGAFDLSFLRCVPNFIVMAPADVNECRHMLYTGFIQNGPVAVRYPRGNSAIAAVDATMSAIPIGRAQVLKEGQRIAILNFGSLLDVAAQVAQEIDATLVNMRFVKPLDVELIQKLVQSHALLVTIEENVIQGGAGSGVNEYLHHAGLDCKIYNFGLPDRFLPQAERGEQLAWCGLTAEGIIQSLAVRYPKLVHKNLIYLGNSGAAVSRAKRLS